MKQNIVIISILVAILVVIAIGCDDHDDMMSTKGNINNAILRVYPADGATGVATSSSISVKFNRQMDTMSVMNNLHLVGDGGMHDWMDSVSHYGGMGHMSMNDMDHMMQWMDSISMPGEFHWNENFDSCDFTPTAGMFTDQEHMIFMDEDNMMDHSGGMMGHDGGMMGSDNADDGYHTHHFMTMP